MKLPATREKGNVVLGRGPLSSHTDGLFIGHRPELIMLYAAEFSDAPGCGETIVLDTRRAMEEMPVQLQEMLKETHVRVLDRGDRAPPCGSWRPVIRRPRRSPSTRGDRSLGVALQFPPGFRAQLEHSCGRPS